MHPRQARLITAAENIAEKTAAKGKAGAPVLFKYVDGESGKDFYLTEKKTTVKSPWSGKTISVKPEKFTMGDVAKEVKEDAAAPKSPKSKKAALLDLLGGDHQGCLHLSCGLDAQSTARSPRLGVYGATEGQAEGP